MANYANLIQQINAAIRTNGANQITGQMLQTILDNMVASLGANYQYAGVATPATNPGTPDQNVFYLAATAGTYTNFGGIVLTDGEVAALKYNGAWAKDTTGAASLEKVSQLGQKVAPIENPILDLSNYTPANGYINNKGKWTDVSSSNRQHIVIPVGNIKTLFIFGNGAYTGYISFLSEYNVSEGGVAGTIGQAYYQIGSDEELPFVVPEETAYIYFQYNSFSNNILPRLVFYNDSVSLLNNRVAEIGLTLGKSQDYICSVISSITQLDEYRTWIYKEGTAGTRIDYRFPIIALFGFKLKMNTGYQIVSIILYDSNMQQIKQDSSILDEYVLDSGRYDVSYISIRFRKADNAAMTLADFLQNAVNNLSFFKVSRAWNEQSVINLGLFNKMAGELLPLSTIKGESFDLSNYTPANGYINNKGKWTDVSSSNRKHIVIPINGVDTISITANRNYSTLYGFLADYNVVEGGDSSIIDSVATLIAGASIICGVPGAANYLYLQYNSFANIYLPESVGKNPAIVNIVQGATDAGSTDILSLNPQKRVIPRIQNLTRRYISYGGPATEFAPVCCLLHYSDIHADNENILRIKKFYEEYSNYIDDVLDTGDFIGGQITAGLPSAVSQVPNFLRVIGNHDTSIRTGEPPHWEIVGQLECYNVNLKDYIAGWGVTQPSDAAIEGYCYYYKDYSAQGVRLICLDGEHWNATQLQWFHDVLASAKTAELHVVVAVHRPPFYVNPINGNTFDSIDWPNIPAGAVMNLSGAVSEINDFIAEENGVSGTFVCWLCGHIHQDCMGFGQGDASNQLLISIATASVSPSKIYSEMARSNGTKGQDCFNLVGIDTHSKLLKLIRIGAQYDRHMRVRDTLCWDYGNNALVYCK